MILSDFLQFVVLLLRFIEKVLRSPPALTQD
jgi:hypothetical protein